MDQGCSTTNFHDWSAIRENCNHIESFKSYLSKSISNHAQVRFSAVATGGGGGGQGGPCPPPLTTACASPFRFTQSMFLEHHVSVRQQATMEKKNNNVQT